MQFTYIICDALRILVPFKKLKKKKKKKKTMEESYFSKAGDRSLQFYWK